MSMVRNDRSSYANLTNRRPDGHVHLCVLDRLQNHGGDITIRSVQSQPRGQLRQELVSAPFFVSHS